MQIRLPRRIQLLRALERRALALLVRTDCSGRTSTTAAYTAVALTARHGTSVGTNLCTMLPEWSSVVTMGQSMLAAGIAGGVQILFLSPLDCLRIRLQVCSPPTRLGTMGFAKDVVRRQGYWHGLHLPGLGWNVLAVASSQGIRTGVYTDFRDLISKLTPGAAEKGFVEMALAGLLPGALGYLVATPLYLRKTRLQAVPQFVLEGSKVVRYSYNSVASNWAGGGALVLRGATMSMGQMMSYDLVITGLTENRLMDDGQMLRAVAAIVSGVGASTSSAPADVIMSRYMSYGGKVGFVDTVKDLYRESGLRAFGRGWTANVMRYCPTFVIGMSITEEIRVMMGLGYMK